MSEFRELKSKRAGIKGAVTRTITFFDSPGEKSAADARIRLAKLEECWRSFEEVQSKLEAKPTDTDQAFEQQIADGNAEREIFETNYYKAAGKAQVIIDREELEQRREHPNENEGQLPQQAPRVVLQEPHRNRPKLPDLKLPEFNGEFTKWMFFKNSFETTINQDPGLTPMQKHQYLVGVLSGEALSVIQGYAISNENYTNAWKLLKVTYDNKVIIIETHLDELLNFPAISKDNKADSIRQFVWHIRTHMTSLKSLGQPVDQWETLILHLAKKKIDFAEQRDWQNTIKDRTAADMPTMEEFKKFLTDRCNRLRVLNQGKPKAAPSKPPEKKKPAEKKVVLSTTSQECKFCKGPHTIYRCEELRKLSPADRKIEIIAKRLCVNCLGAGHLAKECRSTSCKKCNMRHNTLLHRDTESQSKENDGQEATPVVSHCAEGSASNSAASPSLEDDGSLRSVYCAHRLTSTVILSTARVNAYDRDGIPHVCRVLLDPGSQSNLMTESFAKKLRLTTKSELRAIINQSRTNAGKTTEVRIESNHEGFSTNLECLILPTITQQLPRTQIDVKRILMPKNLRLADPVFDKPDSIDLLIGAGVYWKILVGTPKNRVQGQPALQNTRLGWIVGGEIPGARSESSMTHLAVTNEMLNNQPERFWRQEELLETLQYTEEEKYCEKYFSDTITRDSDGRFIVRLPQRTDIKLGDSKDQVLRRLFSLERRFAKDSKLKQEYVNFMDDYIAENHMSLSAGMEDRGSECYVLPHQAVVRPDSVTTKLRVVFDESAKTTLGTSLNDKLIPGPNLQRDLVDIILRFRTHAYDITADVAKMYRQIVIDEKDRSLQRILWRKDPREPVKLYELNTVTYGTTCAPYLAIRCLRELAANFRDLPDAAHAINEDCYMDDVLTGARTVDEAIELQRQLSELLLRGQFHLRKWRANDSRIPQHLTEGCKSDGLLTLDKEGALKTLGLLWNAAEDCLQYHIEIEENETATKRIVLSKIAQVFDPLGMIAPLLINGKIIMQRLWSLGIDWDEGLPDEARDAWETYYASLPRINELRIPRNVIATNSTKRFEIYGFGDASQKAYGACLYAVSVDDEKEIHSHLICSKSKVAPLKTITLPRLELEAALLLTILFVTIKKSYGDRISKVKLWSDSTIVLGWINTQPNVLKTFVANRISKIQGRTSNATWNHVPSGDNPADMLSRGISIDRLSGDKLWWHGPQWITEKNQWPKGMKKPETVLPELKPVTVTLAAMTETSILERFSSYLKMKRVIAYCLRWRSTTLKNSRIRVLTVEELQNSEKTIARMVQRETFAQEIRALEQERDVNSKSKLRALDPVLDSEGLIRVGGRLRNADISEDQKHQIILPPRHFVTNLIMKEEHVRLHHCPPTQLLSVARHKFWPLSGRREANKVVKSCLPCYRFRPAFPDVKMGDLPKQRVSGHASVRINRNRLCRSPANKRKSTSWKNSRLQGVRRSFHVLQHESRASGVSDRTHNRSFLGSVE